MVIKHWVMETTRIIEEYLDGTLGKDERSKVEVKAALNPDFRDQIRLHREVNESIRDNDLASFQKLLLKVSLEHHQTINNETAHPKKVTEKAKKWQHHFIRMAALLVIIASIGVILRFALFNGVNTERLYKQYYMTYDADVISRSANTEILTLDSAILDYSREDYSGALIKLSELTRRNPENYQALFYLGLTWLETDEPAKAILSFRAIPASWSSPFTEHSEWYLGLALIRNGEISEAREVFELIGNSGGYYAERAKKIAQKLKL